MSLIRQAAFRVKLLFVVLIWRIRKGCLDTTKELFGARAEECGRCSPPSRSHIARRSESSTSTGYHLGRVRRGQRTQFVCGFYAIRMPTRSSGLGWSMCLYSSKSRDSLKRHRNAEHGIRQIISAPLEQHQSMIKGLRHVYARAPIYFDLTGNLLQDGAHSCDLGNSIRTNIQPLYEGILKYIMLSICSIHRGKFSRFWKAISGQAQWESLLDNIAKAEGSSLRNIQTIHGSKLLHHQLRREIHEGR